MDGLLIQILDLDQVSNLDVNQKIIESFSRIILAVYKY